MQAANVLERIAQWLVILSPVLILAGPAISDGGIILIGILFLVRSGLTRDLRWLRLRWLQVALGLWAFMVLRDYFIEDTGPWVRSLGWIRFLLFAAALQHWLLPDAETRHKLLVSTSLTVGFLIIDTLWQYRFGTDLTGRPALDFGGMALTRLTGPFSAPHVGASLFWLMFPVLLFGMVHTDRRIRFSAFAAAALAVLAVYVSGERMAMLLTLTGFAAVFLLLPPLRRLLLVAGICGAAAMLWLNAQNPLLVTRQVDSTRQHIVDFWQTPYGQTWLSAMKIGKAHAVSGVGAKQFREECRKPEYGATDKMALIYRCPMHTHNIYLEKLVEHGLIGLGLFLAMIACWVRPVIAQWSQWRYDPVVVGLVITLALRLWPINAQTSQFVVWSAASFWLFIGWLMAALAAHATRER